MELGPALLNIELLPQKIARMNIRKRIKRKSVFCYAGGGEYGHFC